MILTQTQERHSTAGAIGLGPSLQGGSNRTVGRLAIISSESSIARDGEESAEETREDHRSRRCTPTIWGLGTFGPRPVRRLTLINGESLNTIPSRDVEGRRGGSSEDDGDREVRQGLRRRTPTDDGSDRRGPAVDKAARTRPSGGSPSSTASQDPEVDTSTSGSRLPAHLSTLSHSLISRPRGPSGLTERH